jgi:hypothetical protein
MKVIDAYTRCCCCRRLNSFAGYVSCAHSHVPFVPWLLCRPSTLCLLSLLVVVVIVVVCADRQCRNAALVLTYIHTLRLAHPSIWPSPNLYIPPLKFAACTAYACCPSSIWPSYAQRAATGPVSPLFRSISSLFTRPPDDAHHHLHHHIYLLSS